MEIDTYPIMSRIKIEFKSFKDSQAEFVISYCNDKNVSFYSNAPQRLMLGDKLSININPIINLN